MVSYFKIEMELWLAREIKPPIELNGSNLYICHIYKIMQTCWMIQLLVERNLNLW